MLNRVRSFLEAVLRRKRFEATMSDEIRFHIDTYIEDLVATGVSRSEAERRARLEFGGLESVKEECRASRRLNVADGLRRDIRHACRTFIKNPSFSVIVLLTLGLGIGSTIAIFTVVYGVLLKPLPFPDPERLAQIWGSVPSRKIATTSFTEANFWDMRDLNGTFEEFGALHGASFTLTGLEAPERVTGALVSVGFFRSLGAKPIVGRLFNPGEDDPGATAERALLSHSFWMSRFGGDPAVIGRPITLSGRSSEIIGVLPPGTPWLDAANVFVPFVRRLDADRESWEYTVIGRIKPGITFDAARTDLERVAKDLESQYLTNKGLGVAMTSTASWGPSDQIRRALWTLLVAVGLLLAIACVNVTNLLLTYASSRRQENAMRIALGATRGDIARHRITESLILSFVGAGLGWPVSMALLYTFKSMESVGIPRLSEAQVNGWVFAFAFVAAILVGLLTGAVPALQSPFKNILSAVQQGTRGRLGIPSQDRMRRMLVGVEVALSLILLVGAGLLVRSLTNVLAVERGFQTEGRLHAMVSIPSAYSDERRTQIATDILSQLEKQPDVLSVSTVSMRPLGRGSTGMGIAAAGIDISDADVPWASWRIVSKDYFKTLGLTLLEGRGFTEQDIIGKPFRVVISKRLATRLWGSESPIGRTALLWKGQTQRPGEVIGVVSDMRERGLENDPTFAVYLPAYGNLDSPTLDLAMHVRGTPELFTPTLRSIVNSIDPSLPVSSVRTLEEMVYASVGSRRFIMILIVTFAALALLLSLAGVYGVVQYSLSRRTAEIGLRMALGARSGAVLRLVISQGLRPIWIGIVTGLVACFGCRSL